MRTILLLTLALTLAGCASDGSGGVPGIGDDDSTGDDDDDAASSTPLVGNEAAAQQGGSRLKLRIGATSDGARAVLGWHDTQRSENCWFSLAEDGSWRCLPADGRVYIGVYWMAGCTTPLAYSTCASDTPEYAVETLLCPGPYKTRLYAIGGVYGGTVFAGTPANCVATTPPASYTIYSVGAVVPPSSFVEAVESLE